MALISTLSLLSVGMIGVGYAEKKSEKTSNGSDLSQKEFRAVTLENWDETAWEVFTDKDNINYTTYPGTPGAEKIQS